VPYNQQPEYPEYPRRDPQPFPRGQHPYNPRETRTDQRAYRPPAPAPFPRPVPPPPYQPPQYPPPQYPRPTLQQQSAFQQQTVRPPRPVYQPAPFPAPPRPPVRPDPVPGPDRWPAGYKVIAGLFAVFAVIIGVSAVEWHKSPSSSVSMAAATAQAHAYSAPSGTPAARTKTEAGSKQRAAAGGRVVATFSGSGITNTARFTVSSTWRLDYSFNCGALGQAGNFIVMEDGSFGAMAVDELAESKTGSSYAYSDAGPHYLEIDSECSWTVKVSDAG
jgi:hypothetical protein